MLQKFTYIFKPKLQPFTPPLHIMPVQKMINNDAVNGWQTG